ncbi:MFS transporter [Eubacteriales bacterium DFI.9.88]|uniref:MFS transporter n=1 Tax=Hominibacterium faecale TaxID=2839743 RepID=UPI0022B293BA|nr:MFS transporter [Hominibacterium faecale]MDE8734254.1 MFS transporter [Eubacteriales bacterium DFI.9.88]
MNNRWVYLFTGMALLLFLGLIYAWSIFKAPFSEIYPQWSIPQLTLTFTISMIFFCLGGFWGGLLYKKIKAMIIIWISALLLFIGFFGVSLINGQDSHSSLYLLYLCYGVFCGTGVGIGYNCVISTVNQWFPDRTGFSSGLLMMGFGCGGLVFGGVVKILIHMAGLFSAFRTLAVMGAVILVIGSFFMKPPESVSANKIEKKAELKSCTTKEMLTDARFWIFILWAVLINSTGLLVIGNAANIALAFGAPALLGLLVSVCNGLGRVILGTMYDKFRQKRTILADCMFIFIAGLSLTAGSVTGRTPLILFGLLVTGIGYGGGPALTSAFIHSEFGPKYFPVNFSIGTFSLIPAAIIGPMISSVLIEKSGGNYNSTFMMILILALLAGICWHLLNRKSR